MNDVNQFEGRSEFCSSQHNVDCEGDSPGSRRSRFGYLTGVWLVFFVFVLYPLSIGPAALLWERSARSPGVRTMLETAYFPLIFFSDNVSWLEEPVDSYIAFWIEN